MIFALEFFLYCIYLTIKLNKSYYVYIIEKNVFGGQKGVSYF